MGSIPISGISYIHIPKGETMCQIKQKLSLASLLFLLPLELVSPQPTSLQNTDTQKVSINLNNFSETENNQQKTSIKNSKTESENLTDSEQQQINSTQMSVSASTLLNNQDLLLNNLEEQWKALEAQVQTLEIQSSSLKKDNLELNNMLQGSKKTIENLRLNLDNYKVALESNKDDTSYIVKLFADAQNELSSIKEYVSLLERDKRKLRNTRISSLAFAATGIGLVTLSNVVPNEEIKKALFWTGIGITASSGVTLGISFLF